MRPVRSSRISSGLLCAYGSITALIGLTQIVFNALWIGRGPTPFGSPGWLVLFELGWTFASFVALLRWRQSIVMLVSASYVIYASSAMVLTQMLADDHGAVTQAMVPGWWKVFSVIVGVWFVAASYRVIRWSVQGSSG